MKKLIIILIILVFDYYYIYRFDINDFLPTETPDKETMQEIETRCQYKKSCIDKEIRGFSFIAHSYTEDNKSIIDNCMIFMNEGLGADKGGLLIDKGFSGVAQCAGITGVGANNIRSNLKTVGVINLILLILFVFRQKNKTLICPQCAEKIKFEAKKCRYCGSDILPP